MLDLTVADPVRDGSYEYTVAYLGETQVSSVPPKSGCRSYGLPGWKSSSFRGNREVTVPAMFHTSG